MTGTIHHGMTKDCPTPQTNGSCPGHPAPDVNRTFALQVIKSNPHTAAIYNEMLEALELLLDALGALSNPSELCGWGLTDEQQAKIIAVYQKAKGAL